MAFKIANAEFLGSRLTRILVFRNTVKILNLTGNYFLFFSLDSLQLKVFDIADYERYVISYMSIKNFESYFWAAGSIVFSDSFCSGVLVKVLPLRPLGPLSGFLKNNLMRGDNLMRKK